MSINLPRTPAGWIALATVAVLVLLFLYFFTPVMRGHAVEISVENESPSDIFAAIDNPDIWGRWFRDRATWAAWFADAP